MKKLAVSLMGVVIMILAYSCENHSDTSPEIEIEDISTSAIEVTESTERWNKIDTTESTGSAMFLSSMSKREGYLVLELDSICQELEKFEVIWDGNNSNPEIELFLVTYAPQCNGTSKKVNATVEVKIPESLSSVNSITTVNSYNKSQKANVSLR